MYPVSVGVRCLAWSSVSCSRMMSMLCCLIVVSNSCSLLFMPPMFSCRIRSVVGFLEALVFGVEG